jgi:hypothetical protein
LTPTQQAFINHDTRAVEVPARLSPGDMLCISGEPDVSDSCPEAVPNGNFPPLPYVLPAVAVKVSHDVATASWLTRLASALQSLAFLLLATALLWSGTGWSLLGLLAATSPMVLFVSSVMNPSGVEITACLAFAAAVLRITRAPIRAPGWVWGVFVISGAVGILAGPIGLAFIIPELALFGALLGPRGLRELRRKRAHQLRVSALTLLGAGAVALIYARLAGFSGTVHISPIRYGLQQGLDQLPSVLQDAVGTFASLTVSLPLAAHWIWWLLVLALLAGAIWHGDRRDRWLLSGVAVLALAFPVLFYAWIDRFTGFPGLQGREVLPPLLLIPLVAGEVLYRRRPAFTQRRSGQLALGGAIAAIAVFQAYAWWFNAKAAAGAPGTIRFYAHAAWNPPLGWLPWIAVAGLGTVALLSFAGSEAVRRPSVVGEQRVGSASSDLLAAGTP